jgi:hypothetical protein
MGLTAILRRQSPLLDAQTSGLAGCVPQRLRPSFRLKPESRAKSKSARFWIPAYAGMMN